MGTCKTECRGAQKIILEDSQNHLIEHLRTIYSSEKKAKFESQIGKIDFAQISRTFRRAEECSIISSSTNSNEFEFKCHNYSPLNDKAVLKLS